MIRQLLLWLLPWEEVPTIYERRCLRLAIERAGDQRTLPEEDRRHAEDAVRKYERLAGVERTT